MRQYRSLLRKILEEGELRSDRTGTGTRSLFGEQIKIPINGYLTPEARKKKTDSCFLTINKISELRCLEVPSFPVETTKKIFFKGVVAELLWMVSGETNVNPLKEQGVNIWNEWANERGDLGPVYGAQWRAWGSDGTNYDQLRILTRELRENPFSRRHVITAWQPLELAQMALAPCHCLFQMYVSNRTYLDCHMYQRSADAFLGVPFNITSYALLTTLMARISGFNQAC